MVWSPNGLLPSPVTALIPIQSQPIADFNIDWFVPTLKIVSGISCPHELTVSSAAAQIAVKAWQLDGILLEHYTYTSGTVEPLPKHSHREYQFGFSPNCQGEYHYRGEKHRVPIGSVSAIHSGEIHAPSQRTYLPTPATFWMLHVAPEHFLTAAADLVDRPTDFPFFPQPYFLDSQLVRSFWAVCLSTQSRASQLARDSFLLDLLTILVSQHAEYCQPIPALRAAHPAIRRVRDFIQTHYACNLSLTELASLADLSRSYLYRLFRKETGLSLSEYQMRIRISRTKQLLARGMPISSVAFETGFYDQSHFGWHFKRWVGVTPGNYGMNV